MNESEFQNIQGDNYVYIKEIRSVDYEKKIQKISGLVLTCVYSIYRLNNYLLFHSPFETWNNLNLILASYKMTVKCCSHHHVEEFITQNTVCQFHDLKKTIIKLL
jgi:hypothetical protein